MSWQPVSYWTIRCDGEIPHGQCRALLCDGSDDETSTALGLNVDGSYEALPVLFTGKPRQRLSEEGLLAHGWRKSGDLVLCPDHVRAQEKHVEAAIEGLPFDEQVSA